MTRITDLNAKLLAAQRERDSALRANLTLSVFLLEFRKHLVNYRCIPAVDVSTPGEILDMVIRSLDAALKATKEVQC